MKVIYYLVTTLFLLKNYSYSQMYFDFEEKFPNSKNYNADFNEIKHYSITQIKTVYDSILKSGVEFNYPQGGCQNRAQIISMLLSKKYEIQHFRVWLFAPIDLIDGDTRTLTLIDKNKLAPNSIINWNYHVAPCVLVDNKGVVDTVVIDPSVNGSTPLGISSWLSSIGNSNISMYTFLNPKLYFFYTNDNSSIINGTFYEYSPTTYCADIITDVTLEKGLAENDMVIYILNKYLKKEPFDLNRFNTFKPYFGEIRVLEDKFFFKAGYCGNTVSDNISFRTLIEKYPDIVSDAMNYYYTRIIYWTKKSNELRE